MKPGDFVKIKYSSKLLQLGLCELVNRFGQVTKIVRDKHDRVAGAFIIPNTGRLKNDEWYIPVQSIESVETLNRIRNKGILKQTVL